MSIWLFLSMVATAGILVFLGTPHPWRPLRGFELAKHTKVEICIRFRPLGMKEIVTSSEFLLPSSTLAPDAIDIVAERCWKCAVVALTPVEGRSKSE